MTFTTLLKKTKTKLQLFPPILKGPLTNLEILDPDLPLLNPQLKPQVKNALGFGHIASNCPSKRNMMVHEGVVLSDDSSQRSRSPNPSRSPSEEESESPCEGDLLVVRRMLGQVLKPFDESQRENIFHTRCLINDKLCS